MDISLVIKSIRALPLVQGRHHSRGSSVPGNDAMMALLLRSSHDAFQRFQVKVQVGGLNCDSARVANLVAKGTQ